MEGVRILIVEDETIIAEDLKNKLLGLNYKVSAISYSFDDALSQLEKGGHDLVLLDIQLSDVRDGIDLAQIVRKQYQLPFLFVSSNADRHTISRAKTTQPNGYIVKPFNKRDLYAAIELAMDQPNKKEQEELKSDIQEQDFFFIKEAHRYLQIKKEEIHWLKAEANYTQLKIQDSKHLIRGKLKEVISQLPSSFIRIHKSYAVNLTHVQVVQPNRLQINGEYLPIGESYKNKLLSKIKLF